MKIKNLCALTAIALAGVFTNVVSIGPATSLVAHASVRTFDDYEATPPIHTAAGSGVTTAPKGLTPAQVKTAYLLPSTGGSGTIAIITAYNHPDIEADLAAFDTQFKLASCAVANKCLTVYDMKTASGTNGTTSSAGGGPKNAGWDLESALDTQWSHAIAPKAKILVVEAVDTKGANLMKAIDYARSKKGVVSVSMSWGGDEFSDETKLDSHFSNATVTKADTKADPVAFFASSGDDGNGASWPAASPYVVSVGGTSLALTNSATTAKFSSEKAWSGSGGGVSLYEKEPAYQTTYSIPRSNGMRAIPDVSYAADPNHGFSVYHKGWYVLGGTSAGAPQWAALASLGVTGSKKYPISLPELYKDKSASTYAIYFRDITNGTNGACGYYCSARTHYDYVTGLGSPITTHF